MGQGGSRVQTEREEDRLRAFPLNTLNVEEINRHVDNIFDRHFRRASGSATLQELQIGARLARDYGYHPRPPTVNEGNTEIERPTFTPSVNSVTEFLENRDWEAIHVQESKKLWKEPKDLLLSVWACCIASMAQGWNQVANGNLGWPVEFNVSIDTGKDVTLFGGINAAIWFSAAVCGPLLVDPICYSQYFGRRGSVAIAAAFSLASSIGASRATTWQGYLIARLCLGIGIGAKASIVPIWESELLPPAKRGRVLVSWQSFTALGLFCGAVCTYLLRDSWRNQVLSGALPALILIVLIFWSSESPRWLIIQGEYTKAFETLVHIRKERILAAEEFCYIYFQIQYERALAAQNREDRYEEPEVDLDHFYERIRFGKRVSSLVKIRRNSNASIATMVAMLAQQLSGINILAFLATIFFTAANLTNDPKDDPVNIKRNLRLGIAFGAANTVFSMVSYFLIEPLPHDILFNDAFSLSDHGPPNGNTRTEAEIRREEERRERLRRLRKLLYGRRRLLLQSLASGTVMLFILTFLLGLPKTNPHKLGAVTVFVFLWTACYSPGAGVVPFLYSSEVWTNESREIGMSWAVFWNFTGSGIIALLVPLGLVWSSAGLFGIFTGLSFLGFVLVYLFVPGIGNARSLEETGRIFRQPILQHAVDKLNHVKDIKDFEKWFPLTPRTTTATE